MLMNHFFFVKEWGLFEHTAIFKSAAVEGWRFTAIIQLYHEKTETETNLKAYTERRDK